MYPPQCLYYKIREDIRGQLADSDTLVTLAYFVDVETSSEN